MIIKSDNIKLRPISLNDWKELLFLRSNEQVNRFIKRDPCIAQEDAEAFINKIIQKSEANEVCFWSICLPESQKMIGSICLWHFSDDRTEAEVGYDLMPEHQGKGYMSEALKIVLRFGFDEIQLKKILAYTHQDNDPSIALLKAKGFIHEREIEDVDFPDNIVYSIQSEQF